ncbi:MAG: class I adenylate-forming enzyme family protein [Myxococcota bacterium]
MNPPDPAAIHARLTGPGGAFELAREAVRGEPMTVFRDRIRSTRAMLEATARFGDRLYLVEGERRIRFDEHLDLVRRIASGLAVQHGIRPGDRVALFAANRWEWVVSFWATSWLGAIPVLMNGFWTAEEFADAVARVDPALVLGDEPRFERVAAVLGRVQAVSFDGGFVERVGGDVSVGVESGSSSSSPISSRSSASSDAASATTSARAAGASGSDPAEDDPAFLIFTSGTTGRPKAVTVPHRAVCGFSQVSAFTESSGRALFGLPLPEPGVPTPPSDDVVLVTSPLFHVSMLYGAVVMGAVKGFRMVLLPGRFDPERTLAAIERERVTLWMALGSAAPRVATHPARARYDTSSLRQVGIGGAPVSPTVQEALREAFPTASRTLGMGYTSTEAGAVIASIGGPELERHPTSTGRVSLTVEVELRDDAGRAVAPGEAGEVHVRSPYVMLGYWNDPQATAAVLRPGGWLAMGDVARFEEGRLYIDARARDMLLVSAENVSPTEIEHRLDAHPWVIEAAVLGVDDPLTGDAVCAVVVVDPGERPEPRELDAWCRQALAHYKVPTRWYLTDEALPRTPSGKIVKPAVRRWLERAGGAAARAVGGQE